MIRVAVTGAGGRVGSEVCRAIDSAADMELVAGIDPSHVGEALGTVTEVHHDLPFLGAIDELHAADVDVVVDFTHLSVGRDIINWCAANGVHAVVGTTGFTDEDIAGFHIEFTDSNCLIAPNFAIGAVMMMRLAELAAPFFETAEVIEFHHNAKRDAPSGTAMMTAERMQSAKDESGTTWDEDPTEHHVVEGARGGKVGGVGVHGVRMHGMVAHQEVIFGTTGETLTIRHDSIHRDSFMPGVLLSVRAIADQPGVTMGLDSLLFD
ncbi:MAG: 4-hydroxy-tetrahydrodipicolinate reductase [Acidimicrobiales bacterium]|nr:4-hydroxy-tetrahydrodipicolinate reductase [Acidimicrobiales bacterium]RZV42919.1 MAG: 4-hydroxy-tetrahydrodipicolinate reductase [Acidimicrobiales bacterium]